VAGINGLISNSYTSGASTRLAMSVGFDALPSTRSTPRHSIVETARASLAYLRQTGACTQTIGVSIPVQINLPREYDIIIALILTKVAKGLNLPIEF